MSWHDEREEAYEIGEILGIFPSEINQAHEMGHTWSEVREQLERQYNAYEAYYNGETVEYDVEGDWPEWATWYHGAGE